MTRRLPRIVPIVLALLATWPGVATALTVDAASVVLDQKKADALVLKGRGAPLDLAGIPELQIELGGFAQTVSLARFTTSNGKLAFRAAKGEPGLAAITIDAVKGKFALMAKGITLAPFDNPAAFRLAAGSFDECATLTFREGKRKRKLASAVAACGFAAAPRADPTAFFVNTSTDVRVQVAVRDDPALNLGSLRLHQLDGVLQPDGDPLCELRDDGTPAQGDDTAGDGVFSCRVTLTLPAPAHVRLAVQAVRDTVSVLSPSFFIDAVTPLTDAEVDTVMTGQAAAGDLWDGVAAALGDTRKARKRAAAQIRQLPGVAEAGVTADGFSIYIRYANGLQGGIDLDPVSIEVPGLPALTTPAASAVSRSEDPRDGLAAPAVELVEGGPQVGNAKVLIWSPWYSEKLLGDATDALETLFRRAACPRFEVTVLKNEQCTLASIATFSQYGTVVMLTHGAQPQANGDVAFMSGEKATLVSQYYTYSRQLKLGELLVYNGRRSPEKTDYFVFLPSFVGRSNPSGFPSSIVFAGACTSAANRSMATPFFAAGAAAYVGNVTLTHGKFIEYSSTTFFDDFIRQASTAADAYARVPHKTPGAYFRSIGDIVEKKARELFGAEVLGSQLVLLRGDDRVRYRCDPPPAGLIDTVTIQAGAAAQAAGTVVLESNRQYRMVVSGSSRRQLDADYFDTDAIYCFDSTNTDPNFCKPNAPFPSVAALFFAFQFGDETPGSPEHVLDFTDASELPSYDGGHSYQFTFSGFAAKLWLTTWPSLIPATGEVVSGSLRCRSSRIDLRCGLAVARRLPGRVLTPLSVG